MLGAFFGGVLVAAFAVFLYVKIKASQDKKAGGAAGGGSRPGVKQK